MPSCTSIISMLLMGLVALCPVVAARDAKVVGQLPAVTAPHLPLAETRSSETQLLQPEQGSSVSFATRTAIVSRVSGSLVYILLVVCVGYLVRRWPPREHPHRLLLPDAPDAEAAVHGVRVAAAQTSASSKVPPSVVDVSRRGLATEEEKGRQGLPFSNFTSLLEVLTCRRGRSGCMALGDACSGPLQSLALPRGGATVDALAETGVAESTSAYRTLSAGELPEDSPKELYFGLFDSVSGEDWEVCVCSWFCTPVRFAETVDDEKLRLLEYWPALLGSALCWSLLGPLFFVPMAVYYRQRLRASFGLERGTAKTYLEDGCAWCFCSCCAALQEARQVMYIDPAPPNECEP